jgi:hypothetical protein
MAPGRALHLLYVARADVAMVLHHERVTSSWRSQACLNGPPTCTPACSFVVGSQGKAMPMASHLVGQNIDTYIGNARLNGELPDDLAAHLEDLKRRSLASCRASAVQHGKLVRLNRSKVCADSSNYATRVGAFGWERVAVARMEIPAHLFAKKPPWSESQVGPKHAPFQGRDAAAGWASASGGCQGRLFTKHGRCVPLCSTPSYCVQCVPWSRDPSGVSASDHPFLFGFTQFVRR